MFDVHRVTWLAGCQGNVPLANPPFNATLYINEQG